MHSYSVDGTEAFVSHLPEPMASKTRLHHVSRKSCFSSENAALGGRLREVLQPWIFTESQRGSRMDRRSRQSWWGQVGEGAKDGAGLAVQLSFPFPRGREGGQLKILPETGKTQEIARKDTGFVLQDSGRGLHSPAWWLRSEEGDSWWGQERV